MKLHCIVPREVGIVAHNVVACDCEFCRELMVQKCVKYTWKIQDIRKDKELPSKQKVPFLPESVTACTNVIEPCRILCTCEYKDLDDYPLFPPNRNFEEDLLQELGEQEESGYVGAAAVPTDVTYQEGTLIKCTCT